MADITIISEGILVFNVAFWMLSYMYKGRPVCVFWTVYFRDENFPRIRDFPCFLWPPGSFLRTV